MTDANDGRLEAMVHDLQVRVAFQDDLIRQLDDEVRGLSDKLLVQGRALEALRTEVTALRGAAEGSVELGDDLPPHY